jgi:hypothetical protein
MGRSHDGLRYPRCGGEWVRHDFQPMAGWEAFKCLSANCHQTFGLYDAAASVEARRAL